MRAKALAFTFGLLIGGASIYIFVDTAWLQPENAAAPLDAAVEEPSPVVAASDVEDAQAELAELRTRVESLTAESERKDRIQELLDREVSRLRQRLAEVSEARIVFERHGAVAGERAELAPTAPAADPLNHVEEAYDVESVPPPEDAPMAPIRVLESGASGNQFRGTGEFTLRESDAWLGDGTTNVFTIVDVVAADDWRLDHADVDAFGERREMEQGAQVSRTMNSGLYTLTVMRVNGRTGVVEILVEREG